MHFSPIIFLDCCKERKTGSINSYGTITWELTPVINALRIHKSSPCPYQKGGIIKYATHKCFLDFSDGAKWRNLSLQSCLKKTDLTSSIKDLSQVATV